MKIQGLFFGNNVIKNIGGNDTKKVSTENLNKRSDSVELSGASADKNIIPNRVGDETSLVVETEFQPRTELIESVSGHMSDEEYNSPDMLENIAEKLIEADIAVDIISNIRENQMNSEEIEEINNDIANNYYENQDVMREIANKIMNNINLSDLFVNDSNS